VRRLFTEGFAGPPSSRREDGAPVISCKVANVLVLGPVQRPAGPLE
jgi:hypothetical protein